MEIFYLRTKQGNLGDDLNAWIWQKVLPERYLRQTEGLLLGIGTIIGKKTPAARRKIVMTSGVGYNIDLPDLRSPEWDVVAVRGPLTAAVLGLGEDKAVTDGAILLSTLPELHTPLDKRKGVVFMPHISAIETMDWKSICNAAGVELLDPRAEHFSVLRRIGSAELVLADAMHGAIIADALRVPWLPFRSSPEINTFKWLDWTQSLCMPYRPVELPARSLALAFRMAAVRMARHGLSFKVPEHDSQVIKIAVNAFHEQAATVRNTGVARRLLAKVLYRLSAVFSEVAIGRAPLWGRTKTVRLLRFNASQQGYQSDARVAEAKLFELLSRIRATCEMSAPLP